MKLDTLFRNARPGHVRKPIEASMARWSMGFVVLALGFAWGLAAAAYEVFPYQQVRAVKNLIDGDDGSRDPDAYLGSPHTFAATSGDLLWGTRADIVMVGDSITAGGRWDEMFPGRRVINRGIGGDTIQGVKDRLPAVLALKPRKVFLMVGINDAFFRNPNREIVARYAAVVDALRAGGAAVYVQSTLECHDNGVCSAETRDRVRALNLELRRLSAARGATFIDLNASMSDAGGLRRAYSWDGTHLNGEGYRAWRDVLRPHLAASGPQAATTGRDPAR